MDAARRRLGAKLQGLQDATRDAPAADLQAMWLEVVLIFRLSWRRRLQMIEAAIFAIAQCHSGSLSARVPLSLSLYTENVLQLQLYRLGKAEYVDLFYRTGLAETKSVRLPR